ncbi:MAG: Uma2 family endonuclease [Hyphomicrobium sp.]
MITAANRTTYVTVADYLAAERLTPVKHEYVDGHIYAMGGASDRHNIISGNVFAAIHAHFRERCQVFMADMKLRLRLEAAESYYYPDILVSCAAADRDPYFREQPILLQGNRIWREM